MHGPEFTVVLIAGLALLVGAATRLFSARTHFPFTIAMLLLGIGVGVAVREAGGESGQGFLQLINQGALISPDLIIFVFLPALVFESAYAIEVNEFRKNVGAVLLLAVPALVMSTVAVAALMIALTGSTWGWGWHVALVFGALISATDPVAVVAIFRELGVSKRLGVLVEGESLLNDGTSIVVFTLLVKMLSGDVTEFSTTGALSSFAVVVAGGIGVGLVLAWVLSKWIEQLFNDPLSEITLTLLLAYSAMVIAEGMLHVSGVMAVVVAGLWMSGTGKTKISPEIQHFLHRFWEVLGYIANTLIFFLVGLVIAKEFQSAHLSDFFLIAAAYVGVMVIRFALTYLFQPLANKLSEGVSSKDSAVMAWGGLRGAVSLALALIVSQNPKIDADLRHQVLLVTAGVVLLTILVNGTTIGRLLAKLGYSDPPLSEQLQTLGARAIVLDRVRENIEKVGQSRDLRTVVWSEVEERLAERCAVLEKQIAETRKRLAEAPADERIAGYWRQVLSVERQAFWEAFANGTLGAVAVNLLSAEIDRQLDWMDRGQLSPPKTRLPKIGGGFFGKRQSDFDHLALIYDLSRAESVAADYVLGSLDTIKGADADVVDEIRSTYQSYLRQGKERIEDMRTNLPEMACAIETRLATRIQLNFEREAFERLEEHGVLDHTAVHQELHSVEKRMSELKRMATQVEIPETADLVAKTPLFESLDEAALAKLADITDEMVVPVGDYLFKEGDKGDALFVIARGAVHVIKEIDGEEVVVDVLGGGDIIGEISLLTGAPRTASIKAATSVTLGKIGRDDFAHLIEAAPQLGECVWQAFGTRNFDNHVRKLPRFRHLDHEDRLMWCAAGTPTLMRAGEMTRTTDSTTQVLVLTGMIRAGRAQHSAVDLVDIDCPTELEAVEESRIVLLPDPDVVCGRGMVLGDSLSSAAVKGALDA